MKITYDLLKEAVLQQLNESNGVELLESPELLAEKSILKNKYPFKAIYIFGPAGAGKSFLSKQIGIPSDFKVSNPDERIESVFPAFGMSMRFQPFERGSEKEADPVAKAQQTAREVLQNAEQSHAANLLAIANPIVFDTTGEDVKKISQRMQALMKVGYDVAVFMVNVPTDVSVDRDKERDRTVGEPTKTISKQYQQQVVKDRGYFNSLADLPYANVLGGDIYANLYDLRTNELLPGVTDEHVASMKTSSGDAYTPEYAKSVLERAKSDLQAFLTPEPANPTGQTILKGMRALVKINGKFGQNMLTIGPAVSQGIGSDDSDVMAAAKLIADMGGVEVPLAQSQRGQKTAGKKFGVDDPSIRKMSGKTDGSEVPMGGDLPTKDKSGKPKKRKFEEELSSRIEAVLWKMLK